MSLPPRRAERASGARARLRPGLLRRLTCSSQPHPLPLERLRVGTLERATADIFISGAGVSKPPAHIQPARTDDAVRRSSAQLNQAPPARRHLPSGRRAHAWQAPAACQRPAQIGTVQYWHRQLWIPASQNPNDRAAATSEVSGRLRVAGGGVCAQCAPLPMARFHRHRCASSGPIASAGLSGAKPTSLSRCSVGRRGVAPAPHLRCYRAAFSMFHMMMMPGMPSTPLRRGL